MKVVRSIILTLLATCCRAETKALRGKHHRQLLEGEETAVDDQHFAFQSRIVGGSAANAKNYEFSVDLGGCGGSLIYEDIVLTAAHCQPLYPDEARIGGSTRLNGVRKDVVGTGVPHPQYSSYSQDYDFMIYKLDSAVVGLDPVVLNTESAAPTSGEKLTVIGFGSTYEGGPGSFSLQEVNVYAVSNAICNQQYQGQIVEDIMFCAGVNGGGKDSCQGDSGGPLVDQNGVQVGVTSWGNGCAQNGFPGVYARISAVSDWIQDRICELSANPPSGCVVGSNGYGSSNGSSSGNGNSNGNDSNNGSSNENNDANNSLVQPKGISLRVDINFDDYPSENAWMLYNDDTKEELHYSDYGEIAAPGLMSMTFSDLARGKYVFLMLDNFNDGICCEFGGGFVEIYEIFPSETGRAEELRWRHDGHFQNAAGAAFRVDDSRTLAGVSHIEVDTKADLSTSPFLH